MTEPLAPDPPRRWGELLGAASAAFVGGWYLLLLWSGAVDVGDGRAIRFAVLIWVAAAGLIAAALLPRSRGAHALFAAGWSLIGTWGLLTILTIGAPLVLGALAAGVPLWRRAALEHLIGLTALVSVWAAAGSLLLISGGG